MMLAGALIRQFFVQRHGWHHGRAANPWPFAAVGVVLILAVIVGMKALESVPVPAAATTETSKSVANNEAVTPGSGSKQAPFRNTTRTAFAPATTFFPLP